MTIAHFDVHAKPAAQALSRSLEHFVLRTLLPHVIRAKHKDALLSVHIELDGLDETMASLIGRKTDEMHRHGVRSARDAID